MLKTFSMSACIALALSSCGDSPTKTDEASQPKPHAPVSPEPSPVVQGLKDIFRLPTPAQDGGVYETKNDMEIVLKTFEKTYSDGYSSSYYGATKSIRIEADFRVKLGFKLGDKIEIHESDSGTVNMNGTGDFCIISVERVSDGRTTEEDSNWWNRVTEEEKLRIVTNMRKKYKQELNSTGDLQKHYDECYNDLCERIKISRNKFIIKDVLL